MNTSSDKADAAPSSDATANHVPDGSTLYYALLYVDRDAAQRVCDTLEFTSAIRRALHDVSEPQVAEKKIHWWHEELARLAQQSARHPACVAVQPYLSHVLDVKASLKLLSTTSSERFTPHDTDPKLQQCIKDDFGARLTLLDSALNTSSSLQTKNAIALGLGYFERLDELVALLRKSYAVFSDEYYAQYGLSPNELLTYSNEATAADANGVTPDENIKQFLSTAVQQTIDALEHALVQIQSDPNAVALPVQIICRVRLAQLKLWKKRKPDLLRESMKLTPLRKFLIAYRCKRQFIKSAKLAS